jgi:predicted O-methyltransferase YrrM
VTLICALAAAAAVTFAVLWLQYRRRLYDLLGRDGSAPIRSVDLAEFDASFRQDGLGPTLAAEVAFIGSGAGVPGGTSDREAWVLAVLAKDRRAFFEFGTATGKTTYLLARNSPADARVTTITLSPAEVGAYSGQRGDARAASRSALAESRFATFRYSGTPVEHKVEQLFGDSKQLDTTPNRGRFDLIFIDGSHAYSYVLSDTSKALEMLAPGGIILWHDYTPFRKGGRDVVRALNQLRSQYRLVRLRETTLVAYRHAAGATSSPP